MNCKANQKWTACKLSQVQCETNAKWSAIGLHHCPQYVKNSQQKNRMPLKQKTCSYTKGMRFFCWLFFTYCGQWCKPMALHFAFVSHCTWLSLHAVHFWFALQFTYANLLFSLMQICYITWFCLKLNLRKSKRTERRSSHKVIPRVREVQEWLAATQTEPYHECVKRTSGWH